MLCVCWDKSWSRLWSGGSLQFAGLENVSNSNIKHAHATTLLVFVNKLWKINFQFQSTANRNCRDLNNFQLFYFFIIFALPPRLWWWAIAVVAAGVLKPQNYLRSSEDTKHHRHTTQLDLNKCASWWKAFDPQHEIIFDLSVKETAMRWWNGI